MTPPLLEAKRPRKELWIAMNGLSPGFTITGSQCDTIKTDDRNESSVWTNNVFGVGIEHLAEYVLLNNVIGKDKRGWYVIGSFDAFRLKRPKRIRVGPYVEYCIERLVKGYRVVWPDKPAVVYECCNCGRSGEKDAWNWFYLAGLAGSDYITHCPDCNAKGGNMFDKIQGHVTLKIKRYLSHGRPHFLEQPKPDTKIRWHYGPVEILAP